MLAAGAILSKILFTLILEHEHKAVVQLGLSLFTCRRNKLFGRIFCWTHSHVSVASGKWDTSSLFKIWEQMYEAERLEVCERAH